METAKTIKVSYYYACCPNCKNVLIQAKDGLDGYEKCPHCGNYIHIVIRDGAVTTKIKTQ